MVSVAIFPYGMILIAVVLGLIGAGLGLWLGTKHRDD